MRMRGVAAAVAGVCAAATAHALDVSGRLPFVHEAETVRMAMTPAQVVGWLALAAGLSALAARTRPLLIGAPGALAISGAPELIGRHDLGAVAQPGAMLGALLQLLLVVAVVALAVALERHILLLVGCPFALPAEAPRARSHRRPPAVLVDRTASPRAPPGRVAATT